MDERFFDVLFKNVSDVVEALQPFTLAAADIHRMWYGSRGFFCSHQREWHGVGISYATPYGIPTGATNSRQNTSADASAT
jgi:hypothetical protein